MSRSSRWRAGTRRHKHATRLARRATWWRRLRRKAATCVR